MKGKANGKYILVVAGPTGIGKSEVACKLALRLNGEIINADSRQFYKEIETGTAKPEKSILQSVPHHLISFIQLKEDFTVFDFRKKAESLIEEIWNKNKVPVITGGAACISAFF